MIREDIREELIEKEYNDTILFENPSFDNSIVGYTEDGRVIYDYSLMVEEYASENNCTDFEAIEFIDYNTLRALPYAGEFAPIIMHRFCE